MGRPSKYSKSLADTICEMISDGVSLRDICKGDGMPNRATVFRWLGKDSDFRDQYARARDEQAETLADEIVSIADEAEDAQIARVRIDARKWVAGKLKPKKYGDKAQVEVGGSIDIPSFSDVAKVIAQSAYSDSES